MLACLIISGKVDVALMTTDSYRYFLSCKRSGKHGDGGEGPGKFMEPHLFHVRMTPLLNKEGITKRAFSFFC